jgi:hypothetical protein
MARLYCKESNGLTLGPGDKGSDRVIQFTDHYADIDEDDPLFAEKMSWLNGRGCPFIRVVTEAEEITLRAVAAALNTHERQGWGLD